LEGDLREIQGDWDMVDWSKEIKEGPRSRQRRGPSVILAAIPRKTVHIVGYRLKIYRQVEVEERWAVRLASVGSPRGLDITEAEGRKSLGIYRLEGDVLTICYTDPGKGRPTEFSNKEQWLLVLKRKKP
jgi:uncharacterized protein (TIGR03067 family)